MLYFVGHELSEYKSLVIVLTSNIVNRQYSSIKEIFFDRTFRSIRKSTRYNVVNNDAKIGKCTFEERFSKFELTV